MAELEAELEAALKGLPDEALKLILEFAEYLKKQQDKEKTGQG